IRNHKVLDFMKASDLWQSILLGTNATGHQESFQVTVAAPPPQVASSNFSSSASSSILQTKRALGTDDFVPPSSFSNGLRAFNNFNARFVQYKSHEQAMAVIYTLYGKSDLFVVLPTGFGKSTLFMLLASQIPEGKTVVVV